jgi:hypothetical protein
MAATIHDGLGSIIVLAQANAHSHIDSVGHSMLEALGDLYNLCGDPKYLKSLQLLSAQKVKAAAQDLIRQRCDDPEAAHIVEVAKGKAREAAATIRELDPQKGPQLTPGDRIRAPGLPEEIQALYALHSFDSHNDLTALMRRHHQGNVLIFGRADIDKAVSSLHGAMVVTAFAISRANEFSSASQTAAEHAFLAMRPHIAVVQREFYARNQH